MLDALLFTKTPYLLKAVYRECLWKVNTSEKILYLTFDDGPVPEVTTFVLDELKKWNAKATFFCIGKNVKAHPEIFRRILDEGHSVGNHTYNHMNGWKSSDKDYFEDVEDCAFISNSQVETRIQRLFRPPYGKLKPSQYKYLKNKYQIVMWDVLSFDFDLNTTEERVLWNVMKYADNGSVVVFHDSLKSKSKLEFALPKAMEHFYAKGYRFEKL